MKPNITIFRLLESGKKKMKKKLYENYITTQFGKIHKNIEKEFGVYSRYFKKNYLKHMPEDKKARILDIGCGMGHFLYFLEKEGYINYLGIDISKENIEFCREKGFNVELWDVFDFFKEKQETFDVIVMNDIIEHFNKQEILNILTLISKNLVTNGTVIIKTDNKSNPILGLSGRYMDFTHEIGFTEESLSQVLGISGFREVSVYPQDIYIFYKNPLNYIAKFISKLLNLTFRLLFLLHGRKTTKIFTKDIIAVAVKT